MQLQTELPQAMIMMIRHGCGTSSLSPAVMMAVEHEEGGGGGGGGMRAERASREATDSCEFGCWLGWFRAAGGCAYCCTVRSGRAGEVAYCERFPGVILDDGRKFSATFDARQLIFDGLSDILISATHDKKYVVSTHNRVNFDDAHRKQRHKDLSGSKDA